MQNELGAHQKPLKANMKELFVVCLISREPLDVVQTLIGHLNKNLTLQTAPESHDCFNGLESYQIIIMVYSTKPLHYNNTTNTFRIFLNI